MLVYYHYHHHHLTHSSSLLKLHLSWDSTHPIFSFVSFLQCRRRRISSHIVLLRFFHLLYHRFPSFHVIHFLKDPFKSLRLYWRRISLHTFLPPYTQPTSSIHPVCLLGNQNQGRELEKKEKKTTWIFYLFVHWGLFNLSWNTFFFVFLWHYSCLEW